MRITQPSKPTTTNRTRKTHTKRQLQAAARTFAPPPANNGFQYLYLPCHFRESITNVRKKVGMLGLENWRILDVYHPTTRVVIHTSHLLTALDRMRPTVRSAVARDFIAKQWITTQAFADYIKATTSTPLQATPVDTDMDEASQPVPAGNGEPDTEQL
ncbi:hypothetical protein G6F62_009879 [Rhizopus arrhizus]|nr:hypothetical protein G6F62_009879 [Rhizopus arrhizus]